MPRTPADRQRPTPAPSEGSLGAVPRRPTGRLSDTVVTYLVDRIVGGTYPPHSALPIEPVLCEEFAVSRTVVRESVKVLEEKGLVRAAPGRGTRVREQQDWNLLDPVVLEARLRHDRTLTTLDQLVSVRIALEAEMAADAAGRITDLEVSELEEQAAALREALDDPVRYAEEDAAFHEIIMRASGNLLGQAIIRSIHGKARLSRLYHGHSTREGLTVSLAEHEAMLELLRQRDAAGAARAMREHIARAWASRRPTPQP
ncbi:MAG: FadR family transcriptional regulator [Streptomyces sp.]|uniref:FadR/GntR family transcriptional regulator n=1 Tax=Streptomyces sp. TaxID=1931 RepID=UPI0025FF0412|nr:FadR/GntR family transcriptional regulator [Streptomyces sp.]MBW8795364.1 FadR family transcriptional regulator [Streptomyces sp.]